MQITFLDAECNETSNRVALAAASVGWYIKWRQTDSVSFLYCGHCRDLGVSVLISETFKLFLKKIMN